MNLEQRVLVRATTSKDAGSATDLIRSADMTALACRDMHQLIQEMARGAGLLLLAEETLPAADLARLAGALGGQPPWSDLPVVLLARHGVDSAAVRQVMDGLPNTTVVERPVRQAALVSVVRSALRARSRQYELRTLLNDLHEADRRKTEFLATLAHELRNPLAPLTMAVEILSHAQVAPEVRASQQAVMRRQVAHMSRLIDDLMEVSRVTRGKIELHFETLSLTSIIREAVDQCRPLIAAHGHHLSVVEGNELLHVRGDPLRLTQVFSNLLNNAAKYTPPGGQLKMAVARDGDQAVVDISDNGIGLSEDMLDRIFGMFVQVNHAARLSQGGLGIGLTLVQSLVELHGGSVRASSAGLGQGTTFTTRLPLAASAEMPAAADRLAATSEGALHSVRVLIADDNRDAADSLASYLGLLGATVATAYDGLHAIRMAEQGTWDAAILDIGMPGLDGYEVARRLRHGPAGRALLLIAATGWGQPEDRARAATAGFDHHLVKPIPEDELIRILSGRRP